LCLAESLTGSDAVAVEWGLLGQLDAVADRLVHGLFGIQRRPESARTLLVHLGPRSDAVDGHEEELLGLDLAEQVLDVVENSDKHFLLGEPERDVLARVFVGTVVDDAVHVELAETSILMVRTISVHSRPARRDLHRDSRTRGCGSRQ
jgi:hypothetical protein